MKAILIARVSTEEQKEAGNSLPAQVMRLERYCQNKGFRIIKTCSFGESAYSDNRDEFDRILDFIIEQKEKIVVCCDKVDRLTRNVFDKRVSFLYEKALKDELELHFVSDGQIVNSRISAVEKFQFNISLGLARYYSDAISDNIKRAIEQKLRKGEWPAKASFGYRNITREDGKKDIIVDEFQAAIVQKVFELYASRAFSMELLRVKLNKEYGLKWSKGFTDKLLKDNFYHGIMVWNGKSHPHRYPPIISKQLFDQVQAVKTGFNKKKFKYAGKPYIYRGMIRCADCGMSITPEKHKGFVYYHCTQYNGKHDAKWLREEEITRQISTIFKRLEIPKDVLKQVTETINQTNQDQIDFHNSHYDKLIAKQRDLSKMLDNLYLDKLKGRITESEYDKFYTSLYAEAQDASTKLAQLQQAETDYYITAKYVLDLVSRAHELFMSSEVDEKRQLLRLVLQNLRLEGENIVYDAIKPFDLLLECSDRQGWCARKDSNLRPTD